MGGIKSDAADWTIQDEMALFQALRFNKPVGVNKHFAIIKIVEHLKSGGKNSTVTDIWSHLSSFYDIKALDEFETIPFPNEVNDFLLPENEFPDVSSDIGSESDVRNSVADSLDLEQSLSETKSSKTKSSSLVSADDNTPKRPPKRTRASSNASTPNLESSSKRRRV